MQSAETTLWAWSDAGFNKHLKGVLKMTLLIFFFQNSNSEAVAAGLELENVCSTVPLVMMQALVASVGQSQWGGR